MKTNTAFFISPSVIQPSEKFRRQTLAKTLEAYDRAGQKAIKTETKTTISSSVAVAAKAK